jgi:hypothetical protein
MSPDKRQIEKKFIKVKKRTSTWVGPRKTEPLMAPLVGSFIKILLLGVKGSSPCPNTNLLLKSPTTYAFVSFSLGLVVQLCMVCGIQFPRFLE